jgi:protein-disulfide isomerase
MEEKHEHHEHKEHRKKEDTITITKTQLWQLISGVLVVLLAISVYTGGFGFGGEETAEVTEKAAAQLQPSQPTQPTQPTQPSAPPTAQARGEVTVDDRFGIGEEDAPVIMIEFTDYQCPFCGRFYSQTLGQIKSEYVETGKVKLYIKDFPLDSIHPQARPAANAARCAAEQDKFWEYHNLLFENQQSLSDVNYKKWAADLGLDEEQFSSCYDDRKYDDAITADFTQGSAAGIRGTPGFIINGQIISGAQPFENFKQIIEAALSS